MMHGMTARFCYTCQRNTPHLIVEDNDVRVKLYVCVNHDHITVARRANVLHRVETPVLQQMPIYHEYSCGAD